MTGPLPPALARRRRWSIGALVVIALFALLVVCIDLIDGRGSGIADGPHEQVVEALVVQGPDGPDLRYRHPATGQQVDAPLETWTLPAPVVGTRVRVVAGPNPLYADLVGDTYGPQADLPTFVVLVLVAGLVLVIPWWGIRSTRRLVSSSLPTFVMVGALSRGPGLRRRSADLQLYALDAPAGAAPVCTVPVANIGAVGFGVPFQVEVKGTPRPLGGVAAAVGGEVLWPTRRALRGGGSPRPLGAVAEPAPVVAVPAPHASVPPARVLSRLALPTVAVLLAAAATAVVAVVSLRGEAEARRFVASAREQIGVVVGHTDDDSIVELRLVDDKARTVRAPAYFASDHPVGLRMPLWVDPDGSDRARLIAEPYEPYEPILWTALPLVAAGVWLGHRIEVLLRTRSAARGGPWRSYAVRVLDSLRGDSVTLLDGGGAPLGSIRAGGSLVARDLGPAGLHTRLVVGGQLGPGAALALWSAGGEAIQPYGSMSVPDPSAESVGTLTSSVEAKEPAGPPIDLGLAHYWFHPRRSHVTVRGGQIELTLPAWFGARAWQLPVDQLALVDLGAASDREVPDLVDDDLVFEEAVRVPFFSATSPNVAPTTVLLFTSPQRTPHLRWTAVMSGIGIGWRASRSEAGEALDGIALRFDHPAHAAAVLRHAGVVPVEDETEWWRSHRRTIAEPSRRHTVRRHVRRVTWLRRISGLLLALAVGAAWLSDDFQRVGVVAAGAALLAAAGIARLAAEVLKRRFDPVA